MIGITVHLSVFVFKANQNNLIQPGYTSDVLNEKEIQAVEDKLDSRIRIGSAN